MLADLQEINHEISHPTWGSGFLAINIDTVRNTLIVCGLLLLICVVLRLRFREDKPGRFQNLFETAIEFVNGLMKDTLGNKPIYIAPLVISLFIFLILANWFGLFPIPVPYFKSPTNDWNTTLGLAFVSIILLHYYSIRTKGFGGYLRHYFSIVKPKGLLGIPARAVFALLELIQELSRPLTLSFRLFFNIMVGELLLALIGMLPIFLFPVQLLAGGLWIGFSIFIGAVQAFIFMMLTISYISMGTDVHDEAH